MVLIHRIHYLRAGARIGQLNGGYVCGTYDAIEGP